MAAEPSFDTPGPFPLANGLVWQDVFIPVVEFKPMYILPGVDPDLSTGFHAILPTENGARVELAYDSAAAAFYKESGVNQWLYVVVDGTFIGARVKRKRVVYSRRCVERRCDFGCEHTDGMWWVDVSTPEEVLDNLAWLGSMPVEAVER